MPRAKSLSRSEASAARRALFDKAARGELALPQAIYDMRAALGMTQEQFAAMLRLTRRQVAEMETGAANPTLETLERLGRPFGFRIGFVPRPREDGGATD